jgi:hypothetical protein
MPTLTVVAEIAPLLQALGRPHAWSTILDSTGTPARLEHRCRRH